MKKIILAGANGAMGRNICEVLESDQTLKIIAGIDREPNSQYAFPIFSKINECTEQGDCIIDFSHFSVVPALIQFAVDQKLPIVICTTGLSEETEALILKASKEIPVFQSGNMSLGINLLIGLAKKAARFLEQDFDIEIVEKHHNKKIDAPSGTAKMIANGINEALESKKTFVYGRHGNDTKRLTNELSIHAIRGGTIVGEHEVIFAGTDEVITISHSAQSKKVFAKGAINAAKFLIGKPPGLYSMTDMLELMV